MADTVAADQLRSYVDRILRLREEADALLCDVKDVYAEARGNGYDKTAMGRLVAHLRKVAKDADKVAEHDAVFEIYLKAYRGEGPSHTRAGARESISDATVMQWPARRSGTEG